MMSILLFFSPVALLFMAILLRKHVDGSISLMKSRVFSSALCTALKLPRELGWYCGGPITTSINADGESVVIHRRRLHKIPKYLQRCGIDSWNITIEEAIAVIRLN